MSNVTKNIFESITGKTIAIVYIFEGEDAPGFEHYHIWRGDVISEWLKAIQDLRGLPFILDVRTFVEKAMNNTLPKIDYVINLNCGSCELSPMGIVPSVCGFLKIPCIPCDTVAIVSGENKDMANHIAKATGINVPKYLSENDKNGIFRPLNFGSSVGVKRGAYSHTQKGIYQEFICGYDITTPMVYNPISGEFDILPTVIFLPECQSTDWFYGEQENINNSGYKRALIHNVSEEVGTHYRTLAKAFSINTFCRIDARFQYLHSITEDNVNKISLNLSDIYFTEINPMPSIRLTNNEFQLSFTARDNSSETEGVVRQLEHIVGHVTLHNYLLACSMLAHVNNI